MQKKICTKCGLEKDIELFVKRTKSDDGYAAECKQCHNQRGRKRYYDNLDVNREKHRESAKKHYHKDEEASRKKAKEYRLNNPEQFKETGRRQRIKHRDKIKERKRKYEHANKDKKSKWDKTYREKHKDKLAIKQKEYYFKNKEYIAAYKKEWARLNKPRLTQYKHQYYLDHIDKVKRKAKEYYDNNREHVNATAVLNRQNNKHARIAHNMRTRIGNIVSGRSSGGRMIEYVGCDLGTFIAHLESLWDENMDWSNYGLGKDKWSMDHDIPLDWFNLDDKEECKKAFHWSNTQPMWNPQNASKSNRYSGKYDDKK